MPFEPLNRLRRRAAQRLDQWRAHQAHRTAPPRPIPFEAPARFALLCVNYSTTRWLKLMLLSLAEQRPLTRLHRIVLCDNGSRDGAAHFLRPLAAACERIALVERAGGSHAAGMRAALHRLEETEQSLPDPECTNVLLHCDPDVLFLRADTLERLAACFDRDGAAFAGELRHELFPAPEAQASFLAVRRDWAANPAISPWVNHGSPAWWQQRDIWAAGGRGVNFANNREGYALHRGRSAVAAAAVHHRTNPHATARDRKPHFMGVEDGAQRWADREAALAPWLAPERETELVEKLAEVFRGRPTPRS